MEQLYFDNQLLDTDGNTNIALLYRSPILFDLKNIVSNRSSTISLPKTSNNMRIINHCDMVDYIGNTPYVKHRIDYYRNGIAIIDNGVGIITSVSDKIEIIITFGGLSSNINLDMKLTSLTAIGSKYINWSASTPLMLDNASVGIPVLDFGQGYNTGTTANQYSSPCISVPEILSNIAYSTGLDTAELRLRLTDLYVLLTSRNNDPDINPKQPLSSGVAPISIVTEGSERYSNIIPQNIAATNLFYPSDDQNYAFYGGRKKIYKEMRVVFNNGNVFTIDINYGVLSNGIAAGDIQMQGKVVGGNWTYITSFIPVNVGFFGYKTKRVDHIIDETIDVSGYDYVRFKMRAWERGTPVNLSMTTTLNKIDISVTNDELVFGDRYPIIPNLPDITIAEFITSVLKVRGLFAYVGGEGNNLRVISLSEIYERIGYDWSNKVIIPAEGVNTSYKLDNFGRVNYMRYNNDKEVDPALVDSSFNIDTTYIDNEAEVIKIPLSGSLKSTVAPTWVNGIANPAYVGMYVTDEKGAVKFNSLKSRILIGGTKPSSISGQTIRTLSFDNLSMTAIKSQHYNQYISIVNKPIIIELYANLTDIDLSTFDPTQPITISQFGSRFLALEIQSSNTSGLSKCKFIKLK